MQPNFVEAVSILIIVFFVADSIFLPSGKPLLRIFFHWFIQQVGVFWGWLKGSRKTYYFHDSFPNCWATTYRKIRDFSLMSVRNIESMMVKGNAIIELNYGLFRRRSKIYSPEPIGWEITKTGLFVSRTGLLVLDNGSPKTERIAMRATDAVEMPVEKALWVINQYPTLQSLLGRTIELEKELAETKEAFSNLHADVESVIKAVKDQKQRYRAPAAQRIQHCLERVCLHSKAPRPDQLTVDYGAAFFRERSKLL